MRVFALVLTLAACRFGFDERAIDAPRDAPPDTPTEVDCTQLADGTPCDDRSICTSSSSCFAGACVAMPVEAGCQVADSQAEFESAQGSAGWFYGFWLAEGDASYQPDTDFELGVYNDGSGGWEPLDPGGSEFIYLRSFGVHPQTEPLRMPVRRWVSDVQGPAIVVVTVGKADTSCGDGVEARLIIDGDIKLTKPIAFDDAAGVTLPVSVELSIGTKVDALLSARTDESCDTTNYTITVASPI